MRIPYFDNVRGILIIFVVFGHVIQKYIHHSRSYLYIPFIIIYCFHMPLFVFLSGYFSKNAQKTQAKAFERFLLPYIIWAFVYYLVITLTGWKNDFNFAIPWFAYWYFPTLFTLCLFLPILMKIRFNMLILFVLALVSGLYPDYGWQFSLGRTICFAPFFLLGFYCSEGGLEKLKKFRIPVLIAASLALAILIALCFSPLARNNIQKIEHSLWLSEPFRASQVDWATGLIYRLIIMAAALVFGAFVLAFTPGKKSFLSVIGENSLIVFIFHGYFVQYLNDFHTFNAASLSGILQLVAISLGITLFLSMPVWNRSCQWLMNTMQRAILKEKL